MDAARILWGFLMYLWLYLPRMCMSWRKGAGWILLFVMFSLRASLGYIPCDSVNVQVLCKYTNHQPHGVPTFFVWMDFCGRWLLCPSDIWEFYCNQMVRLGGLLRIYLDEDMMVVGGWGLLLLVVLIYNIGAFGKEVSTLARPAMEWYLKLEMALSAAFVRWRFGETSWNFISRPQKWCFSASEHWLSNIFTLRVKPLSAR